MDYARIGTLIRNLRLEKHLTQKQLAGYLGLSDKTISKWERGLGLPDVSLIAGLSDILEVNIKDMLRGGLTENSFEGGNMKKFIEKMIVFIVLLFIILKGINFIMFDDIHSYTRLMFEEMYEEYLQTFYLLSDHRGIERLPAVSSHA